MADISFEFLYTQALQRIFCMMLLYPANHPVSEQWLISFNEAKNGKQMSFNIIKRVRAFYARKPAKERIAEDCTVPTKYRTKICHSTIAHRMIHIIMILFMYDSIVANHEPALPLDVAPVLALGSNLSNVLWIASDIRTSRPGFANSSLSHLIDCCTSATGILPAQSLWQ